MGEDERLEKQRDALQDRLSRLVWETGTLVHPSVVAVSQELDHVIVDLQRRLCGIGKR
ncbi:Spo0E family sporulation regulatory protein-aspartic acid phosphatase [Paenibacillus thermoaerophilus]|uniref:Spo0E family sporulation regulatory protein-aspartic acid phosphatase n=1 Tax=Paenibacillus thermoaerophilus TaxID=1215385 RepID=A0ABW2V8Z9_9BACL|nr:aspartyl-phosphate phosphatase Spo0E family protein [Paenibacillus thermoaerophilus]TMV17934.1 aspartyl-phosphate phosphatase Spo0E family protein [Paenibacillus thermoaerophilus]